MPTTADLKQSRYLAKRDVGRGMLVTIKSYRYENVAASGKPPEENYVLEFAGCQKGLVLKPTNGTLIENIIGSDDFDKWIGHQIVLYEDPNVTNANGQVVGGIRVRAPKFKADQAAPVKGFAPVPPKPDQPKPAPRPPVPAPAPDPEEASVPAEDDDVPF